MSKYGAPTEFLFGHNIHDYDPDKSGKQKGDEAPPWYESSASGKPDLDTLVSEIHARIKAITQFVKEEGTLIQYEDKQDSGKQGGGRQQRNKTSIPFLKVENVSFDKQTARILGVNNATSNYGKQVHVKIAFAGNTYIWGLSVSDSRLKQLIDMFGGNENDWIEKEMMLYLETNKFYNTNSIQLSAAPTRARR